jgi:hypothetical protein
MNFTRSERKAMGRIWTIGSRLRKRSFEELAGIGLGVML